MTHAARRASNKTLEWVRTFLEREPLRWDDAESVAHTLEAMRSFGVFGLDVPGAYGGLGLAQADSLAVIEQLGAFDLSLGCRIVAQQNTVQALLLHGTAQQKSTWLPGIAAGTTRTAFSMTEPGAGSHLRGIAAFAEPTQGGFFLYGKKAYCGGAADADLITILARLGRGGPITAFLVDRKSDGIEVSPALPLLGLPGLLVHDISLRRVFVQEDRVLGGLGRGLTVAEDALRRGRLAVSSLSLGAMKRSLQWMALYASRRSVATGILLDISTVQQRMGSLTTAVSAIEGLIRTFSNLAERGEPAPDAVILATKIASTEELGIAADSLVQLFGARGYLESYPASRLFRDARMLRIGEGPTEALRLHLGALHSTDEASVYGFLSGPMASSDVAQELEAACRQMPDAFEPNDRYDAYGTLVTLALLRAASRGDTTWHYAREQTRALAQILDRPTVPTTSGELLTRIDKYTRSIGALSAMSAPLGERDPIFSSNPERMADLSSVDARDLAQIQAWESGPEPARPDGPVGLLIEQVVARQPDLVAVFSDGENISYGELWRRAQGLAGALQQRGVKPSTLVPVSLWRTPRLVEAALAVALAGGVLVPLDPASPPERLQRLLSKLEYPVRLSDGADELGDRSMRLDELPDAPYRPVSWVANSPAYVIHTSGSTGAPKAAILEHQALASMLLARQGLVPLDASDRVLQCASPSFDASIWELFGPLIAGAQLVMPARAKNEWDGAAVASRIKQLAITFVQLVPTQLQDLLDHASPGDLASLQTIYCGGEALSAELVARVFSETNATLINAYGPTEATIECSAHTCLPEDTLAAPPIGRPLPGRRMYILDEKRRRVPPGTPGEIWAAGLGVGRGYLGDEVSTRRAFVEDPFSHVPGARMFRTGDLGLYRSDGEISILGRVDRQIKVRGVRLEPGEIEAILLEHSAVSQAVVRAVARGAGEKTLVAYVTRRSGEEVTEAALLSHARSRLPRALVPVAVCILDKFPVLPSGKVDHAALPPIEWTTGMAPVAAFANATEQRILAIWSSVLEIGEIGLDDDLFTLGGHSLTGARILARVQEELGGHIRLNDFFAHPTVRWMALAVDGAAVDGALPTAGVCEVALVLHDKDRSRDVPVLAYVPESPGPHPVVVFSHGLGGTREGYAYLGRHWASCGYVSIHLQHAGSDIDVLLRSSNPMLSAMNVTTDRTQLENRPKDVSFVLDQLERLQESHPMFRGRLDLDRIGVAGHSFGGYTALATIGMTVRITDGAPRSFLDPRVKAAVSFSAPAYADGALDASSYRTMCRPALHISGTNDDGPVFRITPEERRFSFDHSGAADQILVILDGAHHFTFGDNLRWRGEKIERNPLHHGQLQQMTTAFWDAHLRGDVSARAWINSGVESLLGGANLVVRK